MRANKTYTLYWKPSWQAIQATCGIEIFYHRCRTNDGEMIDRAVVVMTEPPDNSGMSVTNGVEQIATAVAIANQLDPATTVWIEHYPDRHPVFRA